MPSHVYWSFVCRNRECAHRHDYAYLGIYGRVELGDLSIPPPFRFRCPDCGCQESYTPLLDLKFHLKNHPPVQGQKFVS